MSSSSRPVITRRRYEAAFKAQVVAECERPGASVAAIALRYSINANLVHKWRRESCEAVQANAAAAALQPVGFVPLSLPSLTTSEMVSERRVPAQIEVELQRGSTLLKVRWPVEAVADCAAWLRGVLA